MGLITTANVDDYTELLTSTKSFFQKERQFYDESYCWLCYFACLKYYLPASYRHSTEQSKLRS